MAVFLACSQDVGCGHRQRHSARGEAINVFLQLPKEEAADGDKDADVVVVVVVVV